MNPYQTKSDQLPGTNLGEVYRAAWKIYHQIEKSTRRKPYIRSAYFKKEKIFFDLFWAHLKDKGPKERFKRLKFLAAAIDLIKNTRLAPVIKNSSHKKTEIYYRFAGLTKNNQLFIVQIKENTRSKNKYFMSCFPVE